MTQHNQPKPGSNQILLDGFTKILFKKVDLKYWGDFTYQTRYNFLIEALDNQPQEGITLQGIANELEELLAEHEETNMMEEGEL